MKAVRGKKPVAAQPISGGKYTAKMECINNPKPSGKQATSATVSEVTAGKMNLRKNSEVAVQPKTQTGKTMTIKEVAGMLGVPDKAVKNYIREIWPNLMRERVTTYLTEDHVITLKQKMRLPTKISNLPRLIELEMENANLRAYNTRLEAAYGREVLDHKATKTLLGEQETWRETYHTVTATSVDDIASSYRRRENENIIW